MSDTYTRFVLTIIALALVVIAARGLPSPVSVAHATDVVPCRIDGPLEIRGIGGQVKVELEQAYGEPGSSSSNPLYVKALN